MQVGATVSMSSARTGANETIQNSRLNIVKIIFDTGKVSEGVVAPTGSGTSHQSRRMKRASDSGVQEEDQAYRKMIL